MKKSKFRLRVIVAVGGLIFVSFSFYAYQFLFTPNILIDKDDVATELLIPTGATIQTVRDSLDKKEIIHERQSFYFLSRLLGYNDNVKPGRYIIKPQTSNLELIKKLIKGRQDPVKITFNNIRLKKDLAEKLDSKIEPNAAELEAMMRDSKLVSEYGFDTATILLMFIPNTYEMYWNISAKKLFNRMNDEYKKFWNEERLQKAKTLGLTPIEVSVLASIVEAETQENSEKPRIAGVYLNRLKSGMPLQADPTVKFAVGDFTIKRIMGEHTQTESPYNTYRNKGLPPGPINLPSSVSIDAVLGAETHNYFYFCASPTSPGYHDFSENFRDHINNANKYHTHLNNNKIK